MKTVLCIALCCVLFEDLEPVPMRDTKTDKVLILFHSTVLNGGLWHSVSMIFLLW